MNDFDVVGSVADTPSERPTAGSERAGKSAVRGASAQAAVLIAAACMPILGSTSIAPIQPSIVDAY
ncbi:hypothetical protein ACIRQ1_52240, partial [Streptomyces sp. NPDC101455]